MRDLTVLFDPGSVAVVGASDDPSKWGNAIARQALRGGDRRQIHLVNQRGGTVLGQPAARSLAELDAPVDLAVLAVPASGFESALDDALSQGAKAIVGITAGLGETGPVGLARQEAITARVRSAGAVLVGPNCLGMVDNSTELYLASDAFDPGSVALLSQSGNLALELQLLLADRGLGFSRFVSLGNQADLTVTDLVRDCIAHEHTRAIAIYAEDFLDGRAFAEAAGAAVATGKPVVVLAVGRSAAAMRSAASHTGAMTSPIDVVDAACRQVGVHRAKTPRELMEATHFHAFTMGLVYLVLAHLLLATSASERVKRAAIVLGFVGFAGDIAGGWLVRYGGAAFAFLLLACWMGQWVAFGAYVYFPLREMWFRRIG